MDGNQAKRELKRAGFRGALRAGCPLAPLTTWRIGGPADLLATPLDRDDVVTAVRWADEGAVGWRVLGNGSNLLVRDEGVRGLVLRLRRVLDEVKRDGPRIECGAGASFPAVARFAADAGLAGLEFGAGIPGTIGGALVMNAGWHEHEIGGAVETVDWLGPTGEPRTFEQAACGFAYRTSRFRDRPGIVLGAVLKLRPGSEDRLKRRLEEFADSRKQNQPTRLPSCGSVFLKPPGDFAGRLIDEAGLKGLRVGDVEVSPKHANFIVNLGQATAADVIELVERVEAAVFERFGVRLEREFELW